MSRELDSIKEYACPCGSGKYVVSHYSDDWNRFDETWEMTCPNCKKEYVCYTYYYYDSGMSCSSNIWVPVRLYNKYKDFETRISNRKKEILNKAKTKWLSVWIEYFKKIKSKKDIWRILTDNGKRYPSLSSFYSHTSGKPMSTYLENEFRYDSIPIILKIINKEDSDLNQQISEVNDLEKEKKEVEKEMRDKGYIDRVS